MRLIVTLYAEEEARLKKIQERLGDSQGKTSYAAIVRLALRRLFEENPA